MLNIKVILNVEKFVAIKKLRRQIFYPSFVVAVRSGIWDPGSGMDEIRIRYKNSVSATLPNKDRTPTDINDLNKFTECTIQSARRRNWVPPPPH